MGTFTSEQLTLDFYAWEQRGRGWSLYDYPVALEPPFEPFGFHRPSPRSVVIDDGRKPTFLSSLADQIKSVFKGGPEEIDPLSQTEAEEIIPVEYTDETDIVELSVTLPERSGIEYNYAEFLLLCLGSCSSPVSFEILGTRERITVQFACRRPDLTQIRQHIHSFFPEATVTEGPDLASTLDRNGAHTAIVDCGLSNEFMCPIRMQKGFDPDPLTSMFGALESLQSAEVGLVQVLFQAAQAPWASNALRAVRDDDGKSFFLDAPEMVALTEEKVRRPLFAVVLRLLGQGESEDRATHIVKSLYDGLRTFADPLSNEMIPLTNDGYDGKLHLEDVLRHESHRTGMLLNSAELLGLVHIPSPSLHSSKLGRSSHKTVMLPGIAIGHPFILGENVHREMRKEATLSIDHRLRHVHIIGKTGTGKSTLLVNMIRQDIEAGMGVAVLDPHGDLIDRIVERVPERRFEDVILFDPGDLEHPVGFNVLQARSETEKMVLSSDLADIFRRFSTSWGDQMTTVLSNAIAAMLESGTGGTLIELKRFLLDKEFRGPILKQGVDPEIVYFWDKEFPLLRGSSQMSIITRLDAFLRSKIIRNIVAQRDGLDFEDIVKRGKIFLAKLSEGIIGEENAHLLGSLICSKLHQVVMSRQALDVKERYPFFCYLDEFQHFATPSMASMLSSSRKYAFGLVLAHQDLQQIADTALTNSVITNPATRICFALGDSDAQKLQSGFTHFDAADLMNLGVGEAIVRIERNDYDFNLTAYDIASVVPDIASLRRDEIIARSRERYGRKIPPTVISTPQAGRAEAPTAPVESRPLPRIPVERKEKVEPQPVPAAPIQEIPIPPDDPAKRKDLSQHRYLQTLIKQMAEQRGYRAVIEEPIADGGGRVDVGLERNGKRIACEISVTTGDVQELHNIEKCLLAGYDSVLVCSPEKKNLEAIRKLMAEKLSSTDQSKTLFFEPQDLILFLDEQAAQEANREVRVKGYRVKVQYHAVSEAEKQKKRDAVARVIGQALRRMKEKP